MDAARLIRELELVPHPEGGHYRQTFRADPLPFELPGRGPRAASTAIYFLLEGSDFSAFHRVRSDEVWHHYLGVAIELHTLDARGHNKTLVGGALERGERPQHVVPADVFQAARLTGQAGNGEFALCGCTVAPGFDFSDFDMPSRAELERLFPGAGNVIAALTRH